MGTIRKLAHWRETGGGDPLSKEYNCGHYRRVVTIRGWTLSREPDCAHYRRVARLAAVIEAVAGLAAVIEAVARLAAVLWALSQGN